LDKNNTGVVEGYEWPYNAKVFHSLDKDGNSVLSADELRGINSAAMSEIERGGNYRGRSSEWPGGFADFDRLDQNRDNRVSADEYYQRGGEYQRRSRFDALDQNRDGQIQSSEWQSNRRLFRNLDKNSDSVISWNEFMANEEKYLTPDAWR
jgi:hypothetical protein